MQLALQWSHVPSPMHLASGRLASAIKVLRLLFLFFDLDRHIARNSLYANSFASRPAAANRQTITSM